MGMVRNKRERDGIGVGEVTMREKNHSRERVFEYECSPA